MLPANDEKAAKAENLEETFAMAEVHQGGANGREAGDPRFRAGSQPSGGGWQGDWQK